MKKRDCGLVVLLLMALGACAAPTTGGADGDEAAIYAAAIRQIYTVDHGFDEPPNWPNVYVVSVTDDGLGGSDIPQSDARTLPDGLQAAIASGLDDLPADIIWVAATDEVSTEPETGAVDGGNGIIITMSNVHMQDDGSALVAFWMQCANMCGIGTTYVIQQVDGDWQVTGTGPVMMS